MFDVAALRIGLGPEYIVSARVVCGTLFGVPSRRERLYAICYLKEKVEPEHLLEDQIFEDIFFQKLELTGDAHFSAPAQVRAEYVQQLATNRYIPPGDHKLSQVLSPGYGQRMLSYKSMLKSIREKKEKEHKPSGPPVYIAQIDQDRHVLTCLEQLETTLMVENASHNVTSP